MHSADTCLLPAQARWPLQLSQAELGAGGFSLLLVLLNTAGTQPATHAHPLAWVPLLSCPI